MPRTAPIAALTLAAALSLPAAAVAADDASAPSAARLLADSSPLTQTPVPRDAPEVTATPLADRDPDGEILADAGDPERLLAQAPAATATPPARKLPHTGSELLLTLLAGGGLVLTGAGLRIGIARPRPGASLPAVDGPR
jgi:hypothetical protein